MHQSKAQLSSQLTHILVRITAISDMQQVNELIFYKVGQALSRALTSDMGLSGTSLVRCFFFEVFPECAATLCWNVSVEHLTLPPRSRVRNEVLSYAHTCRKKWQKNHKKV
jgi:hypothetical protein